jgi:hypothetical protein
VHALALSKRRTTAKSASPLRPISPPEPTAIDGLRPAGYWPVRWPVVRPCRRRGGEPRPYAIAGRDRASIHPQALANALDKLGGPAAGQLRIAVFHHPIHGGEDSRIRDAAFLQQLARHGFLLALHGHVHKADTELYRYDRVADGRRIEIVAAGTFGANTREWVPGYPLEYNLLLVEPERITVETRCRREINGAWEPYGRWLQGPGKDPLPRYVIDR